MPKVAIVKNISDPVETTVKALGLIESDVLTEKPQEETLEQ